MADSPRETAAARRRPKSSAAALSEPSVFEQLLLMVAPDDGPMTLHFEDLSGVSYDVPDLNLSVRFHLHSCRFCEAAKRTRDGHLDCIRNKMAANRTALRRQAGFVGACHLGMTDIIEPLIYRERILGIFYYGTVVVKETESEGRRRLARYCERRRRDPSRLLAAFRAAPRISASSLPRYRLRLGLVVELTKRILDASGLPLDRYRTEMGAQFMQNHRTPALAQAAMRYVHRHYGEPCPIAEIAAYLKCHPDYLSRMFRRALGMRLADYIMRVRVDRARHLIQTRRFSMGEIAWNVGFQDQSHFGRVFKRLTGVAPGRYLRLGPVDRSAAEQARVNPDDARLNSV